MKKIIAWPLIFIWPKCRFQKNLRVQLILISSVSMFFLFLIPRSGSAQTRVIDSLKNILAVQKEDTNKVNQLNKLSNLCIVIRNYEQGSMYAQSALKLSEKLNFKKGISKAYYYLGYVESELGNFEKALSYYSKALEVTDTSGFSNIVSRLYYNIGNTKRMQGEYEESMSSYLKSLKHTPPDDKKSIAQVYSNLAVINSILGNSHEMLDYSQRALEVFEKLNLKYQSASVYGNLGAFYYTQNDYSKALYYDTLGLKMLEEVGNKPAIASCLTNIGSVYQDQGDYEKSFKYHSQSLSIYRELGDNFGTAVVYSNVGSDLAKLNRLPESLDTLYKALSMAKQVGSKSALSDTYNYLSDTYYKLGNLDSTYSYLKLHQAMNDTLFKEENVQQLNDLQIKYETEKKEKKITELNLESEQRQSQLALLSKQQQITQLNLTTEQQQKALLSSENDRNKQALLIADNSRRQQQDSISHLALENQLNEKATAAERNKRNIALTGGLGLATLISVVFYQFYRRRQSKLRLEVNKLNNKVLRSQLNPHFIFNALNSIRNFIQQHPEVADSYLQKFSVLMRQVLENSEEEKITLQEEIAMLENYMQLEAIRLPQGFDYEVSLDNSVDAANTMVPPLILQPMIENAIWHGLKPLNRRGKIVLRFSEQNGLLDATIEDNGAGLGSAIVSTEGSAKKRSMGMQITLERIQLMNRKAKSRGTLVQQLFEQGAQVKLAIPLSA